MPATTLPTISDSPALTERIVTALQASPYLSDGHIRFEAKGDGNVVLQGHVDSYFQKQMAQEALRRIDGVATIENHLMVDWA